MRIQHWIKKTMQRVKGGTKAPWVITPGFMLVVIVVAGIMIVNIFFSVDVKIKRKPLLETILGRTITTSPQTIQPTGQAPVVSATDTGVPDAVLANKVLPPNGVVLPIVWKDLGKQLIETGVIDKQKFETLYAERGGITPEMNSLLYGADNGAITISQKNSQFLLNVLWALGLGNKNVILEKGEMSDPKYGGAGRFASTGGWTLATGNAMDHYSKHGFLNLNADQQALVDRVSLNIFRPCCGNSTHFPDCNHGMAMLGLLELMASQGVSEADMYKVALEVNSYWFPDTYLTLATYFQKQGLDWNAIQPQTVLSAQYSSSSGYRNILSQVNPVQGSGGGGCST